MMQDHQREDADRFAGQPEAVEPVPGTLSTGEGSAPVRGMDGRVDYPVLERPGVSAGMERQNMRDGNFIKEVRAGEVVARVLPPTPGVPGTTAGGEVIPAESGAPARFVPGQNVIPSPDDPNVYLAAVDGHCALSADGRLNVQTVVTIPGNLDLSIGNITFCGSLVVHGDILGDFTINVGGSLEVHGNVEDSMVCAGGNVTVRKGFFGHGKGTIASRSDVRIHHVLNQCIAAEKDVYVETEAVNATVRSGGSIIAPRAVIAGGTLDALREISAGVLGSEDGGQVRARAGKRGRILERLAQLDKESKHAEKQLIEVKAAVYRLVKMKVDGMLLSAEQEQVLLKLQEAQKMLPVRLETLQAERAQLQTELQKRSDARIEVHDTVYENVLIEINGVRKVIDTALQGVMFTERAGTIEIQSR